MTCVIDGCFSSALSKAKALGQSQMRVSRDQFFSNIQKKALPIVGYRLCKLNSEHLSLTFNSENSTIGIHYFTTIQKKHENCSVVVLPYDSHGSLIRTKENFNKNGWIRKHINEQKNKFLKINPLSGEAFFKYSCFVPNERNLDKFWNELLARICQIESQLPELLLKIINIESKNKPLNFEDQAIETDRLVNTIRLAETLRQNQDMKENVDKIVHSLSHKKKGSLREGVASEPKYKQSFLIEPQLQSENAPSRNSLFKVHSDYLFYLKILKSNTVRLKSSNLAQITLTEEQQQFINQKIKGQRAQESYRIKSSEIDAQVFFKIDSVQNTRKLKEILKQLKPQVQYRFLDIYFKQKSFNNVTITLAIKETPLKTYLLKNFESISYETKFRLLFQLLNAILTLWQQNSVFLKSAHMSDFTVTKSLFVKLKKLQKAEFIERPRFASEQILLIQEKKKKLIKFMAEVYFEVFFNGKPILQRSKDRNHIPGEHDEENQKEFKSQSLIFESFNALTKYYYPNNLFSLIIGLNYFFINRLFDYLKQRDYIEADILPEIITRNRLILNRAREGAIRVDMVLAMILQYLEEAESLKPNEKGKF